ncbi:transmembrane protein, putative (macronuclear) [Tetrahymena thermophila SB210]|uniref:Transmembrane protein, putative n=1 Tax=Tetrahymena thermophila (strain SB210) TaxID=312017 RepID=W7X3A8_TETTS|nr:transmembrane protein, putative [Tetrahymena thermophila SB210]EWS71932.1 transmembrane protein, putative [Tetrahymena thermophila SB210]|eukprot:XP_012655533.1 transmembrane protein, putative [Tetrahymena thermophila SB210]
MIFDEKINAELTFIFKIGERNQYFRMTFYDKQMMTKTKIKKSGNDLQKINKQKIQNIYFVLKNLANSNIFEKFNSVIKIKFNIQFSEQEVILLNSQNQNPINQFKFQKQLVINLLRIQLINTSQFNRKVNFIQIICGRRLKAYLIQIKIIEIRKHTTIFVQNNGTQFKKSVILFFLYIFFCLLQKQSNNLNYYTQYQIYYDLVIQFLCFLYCRLNLNIFFFNMKKIVFLDIIQQIFKLFQITIN